MQDPIYALDSEGNPIPNRPDLDHFGDASNDDPALWREPYRWIGGAKVYRSYADMVDD